LAKEKADWILANHEPTMLDKDISARLDKIIKESSKAK
jgi:trimethylamine:corrinoid methyltransferase-like protein